MTTVDTEYGAARAIVTEPRDGPRACPAHIGRGALVANWPSMPRYRDETEAGARLHRPAPPPPRSGDVRLESLPDVKHGVARDPQHTVLLAVPAKPTTSPARGWLSGGPCRQGVAVISIDGRPAASSRVACHGSSPRVVPPSRLAPDAVAMTTPARRERGREWAFECASRSRSRRVCGSMCRSEESAPRSAAAAPAIRPTPRAGARSRQGRASFRASTTRRPSRAEAPRAWGRHKRNAACDLWIGAGSTARRALGCSAWKSVLEIRRRGISYVVGPRSRSVRVNRAKLGRVGALRNQSPMSMS